MNSKAVFLLSMLFAIKVSLFSQVNISNPYSYFGLGFIQNGGFAENIGTGSAGIAMPSSGALNPLNPASYIAIDSSTFCFYMGVYGQQSKIESQGIQHKIFDGNINNISIGFRTSKWWAASIGLTPFSSRGYYVTSTYPVEGDLSSYRLISNGTGGINKFYIGNSFRISKQLSIGANVSYLFGLLSNKEVLTYSDESFNEIVSTTSNYLGNIYFDFGTQYRFRIGKNSYHFGLTYSPLQKLKSSYDKLILNATDTLLYEDNKTEDFVIPASIGFGFGLNIDEKLKFMVDYKLTKWSITDYASNSVKLTDSWQLNAGFDYVNNIKSGRKFWDFVNYRVGMKYEKSYLSIKNNVLYDLAFTAGLGIPIFNKTKINVSYEYGILGANSNTSIKEYFNRINIGFALKDRWFQRRKFH